MSTTVSPRRPCPSSLEQVTASNGQSVAANFRAWFRDSKVVDSLGRPLVVYHGSGTPNIQVFRAFRNTDGAGWFARDPALASHFAQEGGGGRGDTVYPVYLSLQNPFDTRPYRRSGRPYPAEVRAALMTDESTATQLSRLGYDGLIGDEWDGAHGEAGTTYLAFRAEQIKSAIGNSGLYTRFSGNLSDSPPAFANVEASTGTTASAHVPAPRRKPRP